ncbi:MAG TPA: hypothetical protein VMW87_00515 [Spirochaetia bacterium]|nr:hypothetical protein [Spirochaetia bacterium]
MLVRPWDRSNEWYIHNVEHSRIASIFILPLILRYFLMFPVTHGTHPTACGLSDQLFSREATPRQLS